MPNGTGAHNHSVSHNNPQVAISSGAVQHSAEIRKPNGVDPQAYFTDFLTRFVNSWPQKRIDELMPWNFHRHTAH
jgi:hypothetical protein